MTPPIRIFCVDDHALFREGLLRLLEGDPALAIVGSSDRLEIACFRGSAAGHFDAARGTPVEINF